MPAMDDSSLSELDDVISTRPTVVSALGIKGQLRFRPHLLTQKPHVVLRRVDLSDEFSDEEKDDGLVYFALYSQKRIQIQAGKEILFTIATQDGKFKDRPVLLQGSTLDPLEDEEEDTQVAEEEGTPKAPAPTKEAMPAKLRRVWTKKPDEVSPTTSQSAPQMTTRVSIGTQTEPEKVISVRQAQKRPQVPPVVISAPSTPPKPQPGSSLPLKRARKLQPVPIPVVSSPVPAPKSTPILVRSTSPMSLDSQPPPQDDVPLIVTKIKVEETPADLDDMELSPIEDTDGGKMTVRSLPSIQQTLSNDGDVYNRFLLGLDISDDEQDWTALDAAPGSAEDSDDDLRALSDVSACDDSFFAEIAASTSSLLPGRRQRRNVTHASGLTNGIAQSAASSSKMSKPQPVKASSSKKSSDSVSAKVSKTQTQQQQSTQTSSVKTALVPSASVPTVESAGASLPPRRRSRLSNHVGTETPSAPPPSISQAKPRVNQQPAPVASSSKLPAEPAVSEGLTPRALRSRQRAAGKFVKTESASAPVVVKAEPVEDTVPLLPATSASTSQTKALPHNTPGSSQTTPAPTTNTAPPSVDPAVKSNQRKRKVQASATPQPQATTSNGAGPSLPPPPSSTPATSLPRNKWKRIATADPLPVVAQVKSEPESDSQILASSIPQPPPPSESISNGALHVSSVAEPAPEPTSSSLRLNKIKTSTPTLPETPQPQRPVTSLSKMKIPKYKNSTTATTAIPATVSSPAVSGKNCTPVSVPASISTAKPRGVSQQSGPSSLAGRASSPPGLLFPKAEPLEDRDILKRSESRQSQSSNPFPSRPPHRGVKRERSPSPNIRDIEPVRRKRRTFKWATISPLHQAFLKGTGDVSIRSIKTSSDGQLVAIICGDRTLRVWNNSNRAEMARLSHNAQVVQVYWIAGDSGTISLGEDGIISQWTRLAGNKWEWSKVLDAGNEPRGDDESLCFAYGGDRIAVAFPRSGVKLWLYQKGSWQYQKTVEQRQVSAITFSQNGDSIICGTVDGQVWIAPTRGGGLARQHANIYRKILSIQLDPTGKYALMGLVGDTARMLSLMNPKEEHRRYSNWDIENRSDTGFGALFTAEGQGLLFGCTNGCALVWDSKTGNLVYGLEHHDGDIVRAVSSFDGSATTKGYLLSGTQRGQLFWWSQPAKSGT